MAADQITRLECAMKTEIEKENVRASIDQVIRDVLSEETKNLPSVNPDLIVSRLLDSSTVQSLLQRVSKSTISNCKTALGSSFHASDLPVKWQEKIVPGKRYLFVRIIGGRAFVDHLREDETQYINKNHLTVHLYLGGQRFSTQRVSCVCEPKINEGFLFDLQCLKPDYSSILDTNVLLTLDRPLDLMVVRNEGTYGCSSTLLSVHSVDWRLALSQPSSSHKYTCQLMGVGSEQQIPVGLLDVEVSLVPVLESVLPNPSVSEYLEGNKRRNGERRRLFITYTRQWWQEYTEMASTHSSRAVKIFALDEFGRNRFVCEFIRKLQVERSLHSPEEAARWISLIPTPPPYQLPAACTRPWYTIPTALVTRLDVESKCVLLCSILLGFGLDAFVCAGTWKAGSPHFWVMTKGPYSAVTFWETLTGCRYLHKIGQKGAHNYDTIGSLFNHQLFYACCQTSDKVGYCSFILEDSSAWKKMSLNATSSIIEKGTYHVPLNTTTIDEKKKSTDLEVQIKILIIEHRSDIGLSTKFDDRFSYILTPALWSYERKAIDGNFTTDFGNPELFSAALIHSVPEGYTFKAFPLQFTHNSPRRTFTSFLNSSIGREIIECQGDNVSLAIRAITINYPENISVTWLIVACSYRPIG